MPRDVQSARNAVLKSIRTSSRMIPLGVPNRAFLRPEAVRTRILGQLGPFVLFGEPSLPLGERTWAVRTYPERQLNARIVVFARFSSIFRRFSIDFLLVFGL